MSASTARRYDALQKFLHWSIAGLIVLQFILAKLAERAEDGDARLQQLALLANHKSVGITVLMLAGVRLIWRLLRGAPPLPGTMPAWQRRASHVSHGLLYALLFALPLSGWLMSSASAYPVSWFGLFQLPDFVAANADLKHNLEELHETLAKTLFVIALVHIGAALKHALIDRDGVLSRITSVMSLLAFVAVLAGGIVTLGRLDAPRPAVDETQLAPPAAGEPTDEPDSRAAGNAATAAPEPAGTAADLDKTANAGASESAAPPVQATGSSPDETAQERRPVRDLASSTEPARGAAAPAPAPESTPTSTPTSASASASEPAPASPDTAPAPSAAGTPPPRAPSVWNIDYERSRIEFSAEQAGARFTGRWSDWNATLSFDPDRPGLSRFDVAVQTDSADTGDAERDGYLSDKEWFDHADHPTATFTAGQFNTLDNGSDATWRADGEFRAKGKTTPLALTFTVQADGNRRTLRGSARIDRLDAGIGTGEWTDTEWVGRYVDVNVVVTATLP